MNEKKHRIWDKLDWDEVKDTGEVLRKFRDTKYLTEKINELYPNNPVILEVDKCEAIDVKDSLFSRGLPKVLYLYDKLQNIIGMFFSKAYIPSLMDRNFRQNLSFLDVLDYEFKHLKFWHKRLFPTPVPLDLKREVRELKDGTKFRMIGLLSQYWDGLTHDWDVIAINSAIKQKESKIKTLEESPSLVGVYKKTKEQLVEEIGELAKLKNNIVRSVIRTINEVMVYGTHFTKTDSEDKKLPVYDPKDAAQKYYQRKLLSSLEKAIIWRELVEKGNMDPHELHKVYGLDLQDISPELEKLVKNAKREIKECFPLLIGPFLDRKRYMYTQGDEFLHHFQHYKFKPGNNGSNELVLKSGIFDASRVMKGTPEWSKSKVLLSYLLDLCYDKVRTDLVYSLEHQNEIVDKGEKEGKLKNINIFRIDKKDFKEIYKIFDLVSLVEGLCLWGRKVSDTIESKRFYELCEEDRAYKNPHIEFPGGEAPHRVSYECYTPEKAIPSIRERLEERLDTMLLNGTKGRGYGLTDSELRDVKQFKKVFDTYLAEPK